MQKIDKKADASETEQPAPAAPVITTAAVTENEAALGNDYGIFTVKFVLDGEKYLIADIA